MRVAIDPADFDLARIESIVCCAFWAMGYFTRCGDDEFIAKTARLGHHLSTTFGAENDLGHPIPIAQVNKQASTMVSITVDPAAKGHFVANLFGSQLAASVCSKQGSFLSLIGFKQRT